MAEVVPPWMLMPLVALLKPAKLLPSRTSEPAELVIPYGPVQLSKVEFWKLTMELPVTSTALLAPPPIVQLLKSRLVPLLSTTFTATGDAPWLAFSVQLENDVAIRLSK